MFTASTKSHHQWNADDMITIAKSGVKRRATYFPPNERWHEERLQPPSVTLTLREANSNIEKKSPKA